LTLAMAALAAIPSLDGLQVKMLQSPAAAAGGYCQSKAPVLASSA